MTASTTYSRAVQVRFNHTDPAGYVFFPRYFEMFQAVVEDWFRDALGLDYAELILHRGLGLPTARTECDFLHPSRLGEKLELALVLEGIGNSSLRLRFVGTVGAQVRLRARSVLVLIGLDDGRPVGIDDDLRARLERYRAGQTVPREADRPSH